MIMMMKAGIRGGLCQCTVKYASANNKFMNNHDENRP